MSKQRYQKYLESLQNAQEKTKAYQDKRAAAEQNRPKPSRRGRRLSEWQSAVDEQIQKAINEGSFDNLPGTGKPLDLERNPYLDPADEMANRILKDNNFAPDWIERDKEIRQDIEQAQEKLQAAWQRYQQKLSSDFSWQKAITRFEADIAAINLKIQAFNLVVPIVSKQRLLQRLEDEVAKVTQADKATMTKNA